LNDGDYISLKQTKKSKRCRYDYYLTSPSLNFESEYLDDEYHGLSVSGDFAQGMFAAKNNKILNDYTVFQYSTTLADIANFSGG